MEMELSPRQRRGLLYRPVPLILSSLGNERWGPPSARKLALGDRGIAGITSRQGGTQRSAAQSPQ